MNIELTGTLVVSKNNWGKLQVPQAIVDGVYKAMNVSGIRKPDGKAHISVFTRNEINELGGADSIKERGRDFKYKLGKITHVNPVNWPEMSRVWFIECISPELSRLRQGYGLTPKIHGSHPFHITVAVKPYNAKEAALVENEEDEPREVEKRRSWFERNKKLISSIVAAGGAAAIGGLIYNKMKERDPTSSVTREMADALGVEDAAPQEPDIKAMADAMKTWDIQPGDRSRLKDYAGMAPFLAGYSALEAVKRPSSWKALLSKPKLVSGTTAGGLASSMATGAAGIIGTEVAMGPELRLASQSMASRIPDKDWREFAGKWGPLPGYMASHKLAIKPIAAGLKQLAGKGKVGLSGGIGSGLSRLYLLKTMLGLVPETIKAQTSMPAYNESLQDYYDALGGMSTGQQAWESIKQPGKAFGALAAAPVESARLQNQMLRSKFKMESAGMRPADTAGYWKTFGRRVADVMSTTPGVNRAKYQPTSSGAYSGAF